MPRSPDEIVEMIDQLKASYVATSMGLLALNDPGLSELLLRWGLDPGSTVRLGRKDNSYYDGLDVYSALGIARGNPAFNLNFMGGLITTAVSWIGAELDANRYFDRSPELEFFRHIRNGVSHGNRFHFRNREPRRPAMFATFELDASLHGQNILFEYMSTGDVFDLFDEIRNQLIAGNPNIGE